MTSPSSPIEITLNEEQWNLAAGVGVERQINAVLNDRKSRQPHWRTMLEGWHWNINGACGELCVAIWLDEHWDGAFMDFSAADVESLQVRTSNGHDYPMRLHPEDNDDAIYILVTGVGPTWRIQGFLLAKLGKRDEWYHDRPEPACKPTGLPAYWVPQGEIRRDLHLLKERWETRGMRE